MDEVLRVGYSLAEVETVNIKASRLAELVQKKTIYDMFEIAAESSENNYENFKTVSEIFPSICFDGCMETANGRVALPEEIYTKLVCTEQNLYELYLLLEKENFYIFTWKLLNFFNIKRQAHGETELISATERDEFGGVVSRAEPIIEESGE